MSSSNKFAVIFDTNAYRELTFGKDSSQINFKISELISNESKNGIQAFSNPFVMLELASHLADVNDKAYQNCKSSVIALTQHCAIQRDGKQMIAILADSESQLCKTLFDEYPLQHSDTTEKLAKIYSYISHFQSESAIERIRGDLKEIANNVEQTERQFIADMMSYVVLGFNQNTQDWAPLRQDKNVRNQVLTFLNSRASLQLLAKAKVIKAHLLLNKNIDNLQFDDMENYVLENFEAPLQLYNEIVRRIVMTGCDLSKKKRSNWIWDIQIAFVVGSCHRINDHLVRLVTGDGEIVEAANRVNCGNAVYSLQSYIDALKNNTFS